MAKAVAVLSGNGGRILDYEGIDRATSPIPPMVMVPTTGGSGADVSQFCVVTDTTRGSRPTSAGPSSTKSFVPGANAGISTRS